MPFRSDVSIDWESSPRIITVAAPSTEITVQDLADTLRDLEHRMAPGYDVFSHEHIVNLEGKAQLNAAGTKLTTIVATLQNAQLSFEARPGPTWVECSVTGGDVVAVDTDGTTFINAKYNRAYVNLNFESDISGALVAGSGITAAQVWAHVIEGSASAEMMMRAMMAASCDRMDYTDNGDGTYTLEFLSMDASKPRVTWTGPIDGIGRSTHLHDMTP